ncbi:phosphatase [Tepiditoga spiralis]|uniref:Phosphatase n=1 Tax=Tepiditoga spiralis TaxID=2108365 RepID=A0A7G1GA97_9BACT|nr:histidine phosphatase family protein [Tepiditoga spiralis]BBE31052.1 phosphatase [Tepiditoga spiralis]
MIRLYITRHGETEWNIEKKFQGWGDSPLTKKGINQAKLLSERLKNIKFNAIYSSSLKRAYKTAEILKRDRKIEIKQMEDLKEINLGKWQGVNYESFNGIYSNELYLFWNKPHLYKNETGENFYEVKKRVKEVLNKIIKNHNEGNVLIVTHGIILKIIMSIYENIELKDLWKKTYCENTSLTIVEVNDNKFNILMTGDKSHLKGEEYAIK